METIIQGTAYLFKRDDIDTDLIIPARYLTTSNKKELAWHVLEPLRNDNELLQAGEEFLLEENNIEKNIQNKSLTEEEKFRSPIILAGNNFGCGSSREHAVWALSGAGVKAVLAKSFARIFFRNAVNNGFLAIEFSFIDKINHKDKLEINLKKGEIKNFSKNEVFKFNPLPDFVLQIAEKGGLLNTL